MTNMYRLKTTTIYRGKYKVYGETDKPLTLKQKLAVAFGMTVCLGSVIVISISLMGIA